jgi:hypothetical protein
MVSDNLIISEMDAPAFRHHAVEQDYAYQQCPQTED